ncbi:MAG: CoA-binding protein [Myxococcales bacterium]|nr:CoA-binding protein [Myxococcales bacterium]
MPSTYDFLREVELFRGLDDDVFDHMCELGEMRSLAPGEMLFREGDEGDGAYVIAEGELELVKESGGRQVLLAVRRRGEIIGEMSLLEEAPRMASGRAVGELRVFALRKEPFFELIEKNPNAARVMFFMVLERWRGTTTMLRQSEKMAQLGTLTAGVAHELNNPAAAVQRGASLLGPAITALSSATEQLATAAVPDGARQQLHALGQAIAERGGIGTELDALARSDAEVELEDWLQAHNAPAPWELAPGLVEAGIDSATLDALGGDLPAPALAAAVRWLSSRQQVETLRAELSQGAQRISEIVKAMKSYAYLDQAPVQEVDLHEGLDNTLLILRSKLKKGIEVRRHYASDLPRIEAYGSELNQVFTNLIDNAADALGDSGTITLRTLRDGPFAVVEVEDDGPGIPPEIQGRIFESFFTTKPPGKGTGLGLDISYRIITQRHRGDLTVASVPGRTVFRVRLPLRVQAAHSAPVPALERPRDDELRTILERTRSVAVVGISADPKRPAHQIPAELQQRGFRIIAVNPKLDEVLGEKAVSRLADAGAGVDAVLVFRQAEALPEIVEDAIAAGVTTVWSQLGIVHPGAAERARAAGLQVVMDACMGTAARRLNIRHDAEP